MIEEIDFSKYVIFYGVLFLAFLWVLGHYFLALSHAVYVDRNSNHSWKSKTFREDSTLYCSHCEHLLNQSQGYFCERCLATACMKTCLKFVDKKYRCKEKLNRKDENSFSHVWTKGNLPNHAENCWQCKREIDYHGEVGLRGFKCIWCWRFLHDECQKLIKDNEVCDFGELKEFIVPPYIVKVSRTRNAPKLHLTEISPKPNWENWKPLFVIANVKSGSSDADIIVSGFKSILNPLQVIHLGKFFGPKEALQWIVKMSPVKCRILLAGGDGTISWLLNSIQELNIDPCPEVGILPMGTGNDLSRVLNWGSETPDIIDPMVILERIKKAEALQVDRWVLEIVQDYTILTRQFSRHTSRNLFFGNYFSIGVDALVTYNFHKTRESKFWIFSSRLMNKIMYFLFGTHQVMIQDCVDLEKKIDVWLDGVKLDLPEVQSVVFLNIDSWGSGVPLMKLARKEFKNMPELSMSDGLLEVFGISSSFHIAQLQVGLTSPIYLGRAAEVKIKMKEQNLISCQTDGEPWLQGQSEMTIRQHGQVCLLKAE